MTTTHSTNDAGEKLQESREDIDIMSLEEVARRASQITAAVVETGYGHRLDEVAEGLMRSAGELGGMRNDTEARQIGHLLELMAILRAPEVLEATVSRLAGRLSRDLDTGRILRDERVLVSMLPAIVDQEDFREKFHVAVARVMAEGEETSHVE